MRRVLPALAALGIVVAIAAAIFGNEAPKAPSVVAPVPKVPFAACVAGAGVLETSTQDISVGTAVAGIVSDVNVRWGDRVEKGQALFTIDDRDLESKLVSAQATVAVAEATLAKAQHLLDGGRGLEDILTVKEITVRRDDVAIDKAALELAKAQVQEIRTEIERRTVRAPVAGRILQVNVRPGETAATDAKSPLIVLGEDRTLHARVEVDQHESWRVQPGAKAVAFVRGNPALQIPLRFVRIEPYVLPKLTLTGRTTERTDVRVLQVVYEFEHAEWPVYAGEEVDVFIEAAPVGDS
jgi:multidrug efflux pump subunit AcrA (membrane-fusion protein)